MDVSWHIEIDLYSTSCEEFSTSVKNIGGNAARLLKGDTSPWICTHGYYQSCELEASLIEFKFEYTKNSQAEFKFFIFNFPIYEFSGAFY